MKVQANQLGSHLKKTLAPCYIVSGEEPLLVDESLDTIRAAARQQGFTARDVYVATTGFDWAQLFNAGANMSLFAEKRIIELRLPTGKPGRSGSQAIVDLLGQLDSELLLIVITPKLDRSSAASKWAKAIDSQGVSVPVWPVDLRDLPGWIAQRMQAAGLQADRDAVAMIADRVEGNLLAAQQEIEKLRLLLGEGNVTGRDVENAVADSSRFDVYKLTDAALAGKSARASRILNGLHNEGVNIVIVLWALTRELRLLCNLADAVRRRQELGQAMRQNGVWNNRQGLVRHSLSRHSLEHLHELLRLCASADAAAKGQAAGDAWQLAMNIVLGLAAGRREAA